MAFGSVVIHFQAYFCFFRLSPGVSTPYKLEDQIVLAEDLHPLLVTVKLLEPALSHLLKKQFFRPVIVNRFGAVRMMLFA